MVTATTTPNRPPAFWRLLNKLNNPIMKRLLRSRLHWFVSRMFLLITVTGRKSGKQYSTPVQYAQQGSRLYIVTSAGYTWWKNLRGGAPVQVHLRGKPYSGYATTAEDAQTVHTQIATIYPRMSAERRARFVPGKVAITVALQENAVR